MRSRLSISSLLASALILSPLVAAAAEEEEAAADKTATDKPADDKAKSTPPPSDTAATTEATGESFKIKRGFYAESDLGVFVTFGGRNTNDIGLAKKTVSNVQPYLGLTFGYDVMHTDSMNLGIGLKLAAAYSGGAGRVTDAEVAAGDIDVLTTRSADFAILQAGLGASLGLLASDRFAFTVKLDAGAGMVDPDPLKSANETGAGKATFAPTIGGGVGFEYFTLLNDFSIGLDLRFAMTLLSGATIPGASATIPIKYTF